MCQATLGCIAISVVEKSINDDGEDKNRPLSIPTNRHCEWNEAIQSARLDVTPLPPPYSKGEIEMTMLMTF